MTAILCPHCGGPTKSGEMDGAPVRFCVAGIDNDGCGWHRTAIVDTKEIKAWAAAQSWATEHDPDGGWDGYCVIERLCGEVERLRNEVRMFQAWVAKQNEHLRGDDLTCEELCQVVCAGPCEGQAIGPLDSGSDRHG